MNALLLFLCALLALSCGESRETRYGTVTEVGTYLDEVRGILQEVRSLDVDIGRAVPADSVQSHLIAPLIEEQFRPRLARLLERARAVEFNEEMAPVHKLLVEYLELRLQAFDLVLHGARQDHPEFFQDFGHRLVLADSVGRVLESSLVQVQQSLQQTR